MNTQHTPGPWTVGGKYAHKTVLLNARGESIASGGNNRAVVGAELEASLVLAAAAPELLAALQRLLGAIDRLPGNNPLDGLADEARTIIARATGV